MASSAALGSLHQTLGSQSEVHSLFGNGSASGNSCVPRWRFTRNSNYTLTLGRKDKEEESGARAGKKKSRFEDVARLKNGFIASETSSKIYEAVKRAQMGQTPTETAVAHKPTKTPVLRLDALGREIDEHGRVISVTKPRNLTTLKENINKQKKYAFQILKPHELEVNQEENPHFDPRMGSIDKNKILRPKRMSFQFVEQGKWKRDAEKFRLKTQFGEAKARELKVKLAHLTKKAKDDVRVDVKQYEK